MTTIIEANENSAYINVPFEELKKLGLKIGDEVEISIDEDTLIVRSTEDSERRRKILSATRDIIERRRPALLELGKGHE